MNSSSDGAPQWWALTPIRDGLCHKRARAATQAPLRRGCEVSTFPRRKQSHGELYRRSFRAAPKASGGKGGIEPQSPALSWSPHHPEDNTAGRARSRGPSPPGSHTELVLCQLGTGCRGLELSSGLWAPKPVLSMPQPGSRVRRARDAGMREGRESWGQHSGPRTDGKGAQPRRARAKAPEGAQAELLAQPPLPHCLPSSPRALSGSTAHPQREPGEGALVPTERGQLQNASQGPPGPRGRSFAHHSRGAGSPGSGDPTEGSHRAKATYKCCKH